MQVCTTFCRWNPTVPEVIETWRREIPGEAYAHGQIWTQASASDARKHTTPNTVTHFQYSYDRARRGLRGIKEQVAKAKRAVDGEIAIKRNRYSIFPPRTRRSTTLLLPNTEP